MLDIQCTDVRNSHLVVSWKKSQNIEPHIWKQIDGKFLYVLICVEGETKTNHTYYDIGSEQATIWLKEDGPVKIRVFPFWSIDKLNKKYPPDMMNVRTFEFNAEFQTYPCLTNGFRPYESLITLSENFDQVLYSANNPNALDHIFHTSFNLIASGSGFAKTSRIDNLINRCFKFQPVDLCQRRLFFVIVLFWIVFYCLIYAPLMLIFAFLIVASQIVIGVKWKYLNWEFFNLKREIDPSFDFSRRYHFGLSPLAITLYGIVGLHVYFQTPLKYLNISASGAFIFSAILGALFILAVETFNRKKELKQKFGNQKPASANLYFEGKATKSILTLYTKLYQKGKRLVCKSIIK
jgi:hypothetical protein